MKTLLLKKSFNIIISLFCISFSPPNIMITKDNQAMTRKISKDIQKTINALIFLNYKPIGRSPGYDYDLLLRNSSQVERFFQIATEEKHNLKIGFDSCSITGIAKFTNVSHICYESCDAGRFSMFISEDMKMYPCSFMIKTEYGGTRIVENNIQDFWQNNNILKRFRDKSTPNVCDSCRNVDLCLGGCSIFPEINLCPDLWDVD